MSFDQSSDTLLENLRRQSLRLKGQLNIPLNQSRHLLANVIYKEKSITEMQRRIKKQDFSDSIFLCHVTPDCSEEILAQYQSIKSELVKRCEDSPEAREFKADWIDLLDKVFGISN